MPLLHAMARYRKLGRLNRVWLQWMELVRAGGAAGCGCTSRPQDNQKSGASHAHDVLVSRVGKERSMEHADGIVELQHAHLLFLPTTVTCSWHPGIGTGQGVPSLLSRPVNQRLQA